MQLETIIGLEFHVQLKTKTKMFCACENIHGKPAEPNTHVCPICLGHPGTLPTLNKDSIEMAMKAGLALNCQIANFTKFDRKNYFYPDLTKGYQISQFDKPICENGYLIINYKTNEGLEGSLTNESELKQINIIRLHLEEDTGKSIHDNKKTLIDYNRAGAPLVELVTAPNLSSANEAKTFAQEVQLIMRHLNISDANMEKGQLRCDANISLRPKGDTTLYAKTEIKNLNSFKAIERALLYEIERQTLLWKSNLVPENEETRGWDETKQATFLQRTKEGVSDYRYFPEPDLPPLTITDEKIIEIKNLLTELPQAKRRRFKEMYNFSGEESRLLTEDKNLANYTEQIISELKDWLHTDNPTENIWDKQKLKLIKLVANWLINNFLPLLEINNVKLKDNKITAENFAELLTLIYENKINSTSAQTVLEEMFQTGGDPSHIIEEKNLGQLENDDELKNLIKQVIAENPKQVAEYKAGKEPLLKFLVGQVMKVSAGKANPKQAEDLLKDALR